MREDDRFMRGIVGGAEGWNGVVFVKEIVFLESEQVGTR